MTEEEYLSQTQYFSESAQEFINVSSMPHPYARNAYKKLQREFGSAFRYSSLYFAFRQHLRPSPDMIMDLLRRHGIVTVWVRDFREKAAARRHMYRAGKKLGVRVTTHHKRGFITGEIVTPPIMVTVRRRENAQGSAEASSTVG